MMLRTRFGSGPVVPVVTSIHPLWGAMACLMALLNTDINTGSSEQLNGIGAFGVNNAIAVGEMETSFTRLTLDQHGPHPPACLPLTIICME